MEDKGKAWVEAQVVMAVHQDSEMEAQVAQVVLEVLLEMEALVVPVPVV